MPNDYLHLHCLSNELNELLCGGKIDKIYQPEKDELTFAMRSKGNKYMLSISASAQNPRIHLTSIKKENPSTAPTLCMHLRKLLMGGYITGITLANNDRIFDIGIISINELNDKVNYHLIFEMMGRYSNIMLLNERYTILDAVKQMPYDGATKRCLIIGAKYEFPEQSKILPKDYDTIGTYLATYDGESDIVKFFLSGVSGLAPQSAIELLGSYDGAKLSHDNITAITNKLDIMYNIITSPSYCPCTVSDDKGNSKDYYIYPYKNIVATTPHASMSDAIEACLLSKDTNERQRERTKHLSQAVKKYRSRQQKKLDKANEKLIECEKIDTYKKYGELLTCNLHLIKKGDSSITLTDYYDEAMPQVTVPLNPLLHPTGCAQEYFKKYNKLKRTLAVIVGQITETESAIAYSHSIDSGIMNCTSTSELMQIEEELISINALRKPSAKKNRNAKPSEPYYYELDDFSILVGKNNIQNDRLTFKVANGNDLWAHALGYHGSHVIVFAEGREIPNNIIEAVCQLAAYYSQGNTNDKVAVDYTLRKNVKRDSSGNLGMVTYSNQSTAYVKPDKLDSLVVALDK